MLADDIRARILLNLARGSSARMDAAWDLAGFRAERVYSQLKGRDGRPYHSMRNWWKGELQDYLPWLEVRKLTEMGMALFPIRASVDKALQERKKSFGWFKKALAHLAREHTTLDEIGRCAEAGVPLACEMFPPKRIKAVDVISLKVTTNPQERTRLLARLIKFTIANGFRDTEEAMLGILRSLDGELPPEYRDFTDLIQAGTFSCPVCGKIPSPPALGKSTNGHRAAVCAEPCLAISQKRNPHE